MESVFDILYLRRPVLNYVCPPVCEVLFSGTSSPVIVLDPFLPNGAPSGVERGGSGGFLLSWNRYPGAICYSVYQADNENEPFGTYHLIAECIPNPEFTLPPGRGPFRVTAITPDGETPPSAPVYGAGDGAPVVTVEASEPETACDQDPGVFTFSRTQPLTNPLIVKYVVSGTADPDVDYSALSGEATIPAGLTFVDVDVIPLDSGLLTDKTVIVTIVTNVNDEYIIGTPDDATVTIGSCVSCADPGFWDLGLDAFRSGGLVQSGGKAVNVSSGFTILSRFDAGTLDSPLNTFRLASDSGVGLNQVGNNVFANGSFFQASDVGKTFHWSVLDVRYLVTGFVSDTEITVNTSNTVGTNRNSNPITASQINDIVTASSSFFTVDDVGATITWGTALTTATIIGFNSATEVQVDTFEVQAVQTIQVQLFFDGDVEAYSIAATLDNARINPNGDIAVSQNNRIVLFKVEDSGIATFKPTGVGMRRLNVAGNILGTNSRYYYRDGTDVAVGIALSLLTSGAAQRDLASGLSQDSDRLLEFQRDATLGQNLRSWNNGVLTNVNPSPLPPPPSFFGNHQFVTGHAISPNGHCIVNCVGFSPTFATGLYWYLISPTGVTLASFAFVEGTGQINGCHGVNDSGQCALYIKPVGVGNVPALGNSDGTITSIPLLPGNTNGEASFLNSNGTVVGFMNVGSTNTAFFYKNGVTKDLNDYVPQSFKDAGWVVTAADLISDDGYIYGKAKISGTDATFLMCHSDFI